MGLLEKFAQRSIQVNDAGARLSYFDAGAANTAADAKVLICLHGLNYKSRMDLMHCGKPAGSALTALIAQLSSNDSCRMPNSLMSA